MRTLIRCLLMLFGLLSALPVRPVAAETSLATWYGPGFDGSLMANGQVYNMHDPTTTASNLYPLGSWLRVTNLQNGREVIVQVKDRGAFRHAVDLSMAAFSLLDDLSLGVLPVDVRPSAPPLPGPHPPAPVDSLSVTVAPGDSLTELAARYGTTVETLMYLNGLPSPHYIQIGTVLVVPPPRPSASPASAQLAALPTGATTAVGSPPATDPGSAPAAAPAGVAPAAVAVAAVLPPPDPGAATAPALDDALAGSPAAAVSPTTGPAAAAAAAPAAASSATVPTTTSAVPAAAASVPANTATAGQPTTAATRAALAAAPPTVAGNQAPPRFATVTQVDGESVARIDRRPVAGIAQPPDVDFAYLRQEASSASALLGAIPRGEPVEVLGITDGERVSGGENRWWRVRYGGQLGYVWYPLISFG